MQNENSPIGKYGVLLAAIISIASAVTAVAQAVNAVGSARTAGDSASSAKSASNTATLAKDTAQQLCESARRNSEYALTMMKQINGTLGELISAIHKRGSGAEIQNAVTPIYHEKVKKIDDALGESLAKLESCPPPSAS